MKFNQKAKKGQGVVEYAGALVVAALVVAAVIASGPGAIDGLFGSVTSGIESTLTADLGGG